LSNAKFELGPGVQWKNGVSGAEVRVSEGQAIATADGITSCNDQPGAYITIDMKNVYSVQGFVLRHTPGEKYCSQKVELSGAW